MQPLSIASAGSRSPRWSSPLIEWMPAEEVRPITYLRRDSADGSWRLVRGGTPNFVELHRLDDLLSITFAAFTTAFAATVAARLLRAWTPSWSDRALTGTPTVAGTRALPQSPIEAAKARWRVRALAEAKFAERLLDAAGDVNGLPMPPADGDDGERRR